MGGGSTGLRTNDFDNVKTKTFNTIDEAQGHDKIRFRLRFSFPSKVTSASLGSCRTSNSYSLLKAMFG